MSAATPCIASLREFRRMLKRDGNLIGAYWVGRCIMRLERFLGSPADALTDDEMQSARMPFDDKPQDSPKVD